MFEDWVKETIVLVVMLIIIWVIPTAMESSFKWKAIFSFGAVIGVLLFFEGGLNLRKK